MSRARAFVKITPPPIPRFRSGYGPEERRLGQAFPSHHIFRARSALTGSKNFPGFLDKEIRSRIWIPKNFWAENLESPCCLTGACFTPFSDRVESKSNYFLQTPELTHSSSLSPLFKEGGEMSE